MTEQDLTEWIEAIADGRIVASRWVRMAARRHLIDLERADSDEFPFVFNSEIAAQALGFYPAFLSHSKGQYAGQPFHLSPIQSFIVASIFGWRHRQTGFRRFRRVFYTVARKNGKTTLAAGLGLLVFCCDVPFEPDAEVYCAATTKDQAAILHLIAVKMVLANDSLRKRFTLYKAGQNYSAILAPDPPHNGSVFRPIGSDSKSTDGLNISCVIKDELHEWKAHHRGLKDKLETGSGSRRQPLDITISTAGTDQSLFYNQELASSKSMLEAVANGQPGYNDRLFSIICTLDEERPCSCGDSCELCEDGTIPGDDPFDETNWQKANPDLDITTPSLAYMREQAKRADQEPSFRNNFLRYHLNQQVSSSLKLIDPKTWSEQRRNDLDWSAADKIVGGFDLGWRDDFAAVVVAGRWVTDDQIFYGIKGRVFCCENTERRTLTDEPFASWVADGWLDVTPGNTTDIGRVKDCVLEYMEEGCTQWRFDPHSARQLGTELGELGAVPVEFPQNHSRFNEPLRDMLAKIKSREFHHDGNPVIAWMAGNLVGEENTKGQLFPSKGRSVDKIDGMVAAIMAFSGCREIVDTTASPRSDYYENNSLEEIVF